MNIWAVAEEVAGQCEGKAINKCHRTIASTMKTIFFKKDNHGRNYFKHFVI